LSQASTSGIYGGQIEWHGDRFFCENFGFAPSVLLHEFYTFIQSVIHSLFFNPSSRLYNLSNWDYQ
jgi:hypothetical protein